MPSDNPHTAIPSFPVVDRSPTRTRMLPAPPETSVPRFPRVEVPPRGCAPGTRPRVFRAVSRRPHALRRVVHNGPHAVHRACGKPPLPQVFGAATVGPRTPQPQPHAHAATRSSPPSSTPPAGVRTGQRHGPTTRAPRPENTALTGHRTTPGHPIGPCAAKNCGWRRAQCLPGSHHRPRRTIGTTRHVPDEPFGPTVRRGSE